MGFFTTHKPGLKSSLNKSWDFCFQGHVQFLALENSEIKFSLPLFLMYDFIQPFNDENCLN